MSDPGIHRVGKPLDFEAAQSRAAQAAALGDTLSLRVLSALAAGATVNVTLTFTNPSKTTVTFTSKLYSGTF